MRHIPPENLETAFVPAGTLTFSGLMKCIAVADNLPRSRQRDLRSALHRTAAALEKTLTTIPADPRWLQPRLSKISPAALGLSAKSWSNILSDVRAALNLAGITRQRINKPHHLSSEWRPIWNKVLALNDISMKSNVASFIYFLNGQEVSPEEVRDDHAIAFRDAVALNEIRRSPNATYENAIIGWNLAVKCIEDWPQQRLSRPSKAVLVRLPLEQFPVAFVADLEKYLDRQANPSFSNPHDRIRALRPASLDLYRRRLRYFASVLVHAGIPREEIKGLDDLVSPANAERGLLWMHDRKGKKTAMLADMALFLSGVARHYVLLPKVEQEFLDRLVTRTAMVPRKGMTQKNRKRLRHLYADFGAEMALHRLDEVITRKQNR